MNTSTLKFISLISLSAIIGLSSCKDDQEDILPSVIPTVDQNTYLQGEIHKLGAPNLGGFAVPSFYDLPGALSPGLYVGQERRVAQLQEIVDSSRNEPIYWDIRAALENVNLDMFTSTAAQGNSNLRTKIDELNFDNGNTSVADAFAELADSLVMSSQANYADSAYNGKAGMIWSGGKKRHVTANGLELAEVLEKGIFGALFYNQMVDDYLSSTQVGVNNPKGNNESSAGSDYATKGTARQHALDEAFGYLGANPNTYPNTTNTGSGDGTFISDYTFDFSDEIEAEFGVNPARKLMDAFIFGRSVLKAGQGFGPTNETTNETYLNAAVADIKLYSEIGTVTAAYHYLNSAIADISDQDKVHHLSEALGFLYNLCFNKGGRLTSEEAHEAAIALGWPATDNSLKGIYSINLWDVTDEQMRNAKTILDKSFPGFGSLPL